MQPPRESLGGLTNNKIPGDITHLMQENHTPDRYADEPDHFHAAVRAELGVCSKQFPVL